MFVSLLFIVLILFYYYLVNHYHHHCNYYGLNRGYYMVILDLSLVFYVNNWSIHCLCKPQ